MDKKQQTLTGEKPFVVRNKKIIKSGTIKFYPPKEETTESIIDELINTHNRTNFYSLFSGGKDSMSTTHILAEKYPENFSEML